MSEPLSIHFSASELGVIGCEQRILDNARYLCMNLLEPIRQHFGCPMNIHDGYRDTNHNTRVGGKPTSFHLFNGGKSAADFDITNHTFKEVFDWIRLQSNLPFDKVILERNTAGADATVHIQADRTTTPRRQAYIGGTGDSHNYISVEVK